MGGVARGDEAAVVEHQRLVRSGLHRLDAGENAIELRMGVQLLVLLRRPGTPDMDGKEPNPTGEHLRSRPFPFGNDDDGRSPDCQPRILIGRAFDAAGHHQPDMDAVDHAVGFDHIEEPRLEGLAGEADVDPQHLRPVP